MRITTALWDGSRWLIGGVVDPYDEAACRGMIWTSEDGRAWTEAEVPQPVCIGITAMTQGKDGYIAAGRRCYEDGRSTAILWRSADARQWKPLGSGYLGDTFEECFAVENVGVTEAGIVLAARKGYPPGGEVRVFESPDGVDWRKVSPETFGAEPVPPDAPHQFRVRLFGADMVQVDESHVVLATGCNNECTVGLWRSGEAWTWKKVGEVDAGFAREVSIVDGPRLLVTTGDDVATTWVPDADGSYRFVDGRAISQTSLAYDGGVYLLAGQSESGTVVAVSSDGEAWTDTLAPEGCSFYDVVGGRSQFLAATYSTRESSDCDKLWLVHLEGG